MKQSCCRRSALKHRSIAEYEMDLLAGAFDESRKTSPGACCVLWQVVPASRNVSNMAGTVLSGLAALHVKGCEYETSPPKFTYLE